MTTRAAIDPTTIPAIVPPDRLFLDCEEVDAPAAVSCEDVRAATKATVGPPITYGDCYSMLTVYVPVVLSSERQ